MTGIGKAKLTERENEVLKKYKTAQLLSKKDEFTIKGLQSSERFFSIGLDWDNMVEIAKTTEEGERILKEGYYVVISI
ncbi:MAG: hypothetical protein KAQ87_02970 [Candidatus Pacebacteria bacterium]|nr:hypothetical protein [Candidatus Paceibacterota bacterium]